MLLSVVVHIYSLRWTAPAAIMLGSAPTFISMWAAIRTATSILPRRFYTNLDDRLYSLYQRLVLFFFHTYTGVEVKLYGDASSLYGKKENIIFICNHQSTVDWVIADMLAAPQGSIGSIRYILKDGLKFFPLYGFYFRQHSCIYVKRSGKFQQEKANKQLTDIKDTNTPVWLVIFPEGTRMKPDLPEVIEKSRKAAVDQGFEKFIEVLTPRLKAFQRCVEQLQGHVEAVYDVTIAYSNTTHPDTGERTVAPGMPEYLTGVCPEIHINFDRVPIDNVPNGDTEMTKWLFDRFRRKDRLMSHFYSREVSERGRFPGECTTLEIKRRQTLPSFLFFTSCLSLLLATPGGRSMYWKVAVCGTVAGCTVMCIKS